MIENNKTRLFVAIEFPHVIQHEVHRIQTDIKKAALCEGRFVDPYDIHMTLQFIGEVEQGQVDVIADALVTITAEPMKAYLGHLELFLSGRIVKIIFVQVLCLPLDAVVRQISQVLVPWAKPEDRDFVSHLTVMRVKKVHNLEEFMVFVKSYKVDPIEFVIDRFSLIESTLTVDGPVYRKIREYKF